VGYLIMCCNIDPFALMGKQRVRVLRGPFVGRGVVRARNSFEAVDRGQCEFALDAARMTFDKSDSSNLSSIHLIHDTGFT
jgi:hypothetical protein